MSTPAVDRTAPRSDDPARREHERRKRAWSPAERWRAIQETSRWADARATMGRNTPAACIAQERGRRRS